ncbi:catechol 2,3-dioxygenase-like lactoylglutathione lyase family enzyme [Ureibacillus xyleni]|uniref:Catechol 2,3-dioxygenase-like lactoylglutathione lyase family enzyme n=1 Tax=Ureibacillus xyleni TaxID=614648 RepID=A0A285SRD8_9BACL|nr:VOC family protein [Ureibacillus xyleni]SOC08678.1 catechol 2,3-dioxygenase-like lactoylglutathione lyase family enzyme [Ureibacillus xyleni]
MITNIGTVAIYVDDQQKAKEFWTKKVGFVVIAEHPMGPNAFWLEVAPENAKSRLVIYPKAMMKGSENLKASIVFECDNVLETYETMRENGVSFKGEPQEMQWGTFVQFSDEDGNTFLLRG